MKSTARAKLKAGMLFPQVYSFFLNKYTCGNNISRIYSDNLRKIRMNQPITKIISNQVDIKLSQFTQEELDSVLRKIKKRKAAGLDEIPPEECKTMEFDNILLRYCNAVYNQNTIDRLTKGCILLFSKKVDLRITKNYRSITLTFIATKIYNALLCNRIELKIEKIFRKNQNGFRRNWSTTSQILTIHQILGVDAENLETTLLFVDFSKAFDSIPRGKMEKIVLL